MHDYDERIWSYGCEGNRKKTFQWLLRGEMLHQNLKSKEYVVPIKSWVDYIRTSREKNIAILKMSNSKEWPES